MLGLGPKCAGCFLVAFAWAWAALTRTRTPTLTPTPDPNADPSPTTNLNPNPRWAWESDAASGRRWRTRTWRSRACHRRRAGRASGRCCFYAVYDGHGGSEASEFAKAHLHRHLLRPRAAASRRASCGGGRARRGRGRGRAPGAPPTAAELAASLRAAFLSTDAQFLEATQSCSGSTAVCALISPTHLLVANAGDSRRTSTRRQAAAHDSGP